jgi:peptidoglycan/xylan/chitin deacetylase (PgdA/CDA1 family)
MSNSRLIEFGGHTADHHILSRLSDAEAYDQIQRCRTALDKIIQPSVKSWAYPNGTLSCFNNAHRQVLTDQGFRTTFTALPEYISVESDPGQLGRWGVGSGMTVSELTDIVIKRDRWKSLELNNRLKTIAYGGFR